MNQLGKLLVAVDLGPESDALIDRVLALYPQDVDRINVVHVLRHESNLGADKSGEALDYAHLRRMHDHATMRVKNLFRRHDIVLPCEQVYVCYGEPAHEIKKLARAIGADMVIVGSHCKQNDWLGLPGSTTNCVLQGMTSDVIAIRV